MQPAFPEHWSPSHTSYRRTGCPPRTSTKDTPGIRGCFAQVWWIAYGPPTRSERRAYDNLAATGI